MAKQRWRNAADKRIKIDQKRIYSNLCCCFCDAGCLDNHCAAVLRYDAAYEIEISGDSVHNHFGNLDGVYEVNFGYGGMDANCACLFGQSGCLWGGSFVVSTVTYKIGFRVCCGIKSGNCCVALQGQVDRQIFSVFSRLYRKTGDCINTGGADTPNLSDLLPVTLDLSLGSGLSGCGADDFSTDLGGQMEIRVV